MQVQLNTTTNNYQNPNFKAKFSKQAELHLNKELQRLEQLSKDEMYWKHYTECTTFAKQLINNIKGTNLDGKPTLIDINKGGDKFEIKKYRTAVDMLKGNYNYSKITVDKHIVNPLVDVLLAVKNTLLGDKYKQEQADDEQKYNKIKRLLNVRHSDFIDKYGNDIRKSEISTHYTPMDWHAVSGIDNNGHYWRIETMGKYY